MKYLPPKPIKSTVDWEISDTTLSLIEHYAKYTKYSEAEVVDLFMTNLASDENFIEWANGQRYSKKLKALLDFYDIKRQTEKVEDNEAIKETTTKE